MIRKLHARYRLFSLGLGKSKANASKMAQAKILRKMHLFENEQMHKRLTWQGTFQTLLFAGLCVVWGKPDSLPIYSVIIFLGIFMAGQGVFALHGVGLSLVKMYEFEKAAYVAAIADFKVKYKKDYFFVSKDVYEEHKKNGTATELIASARDISEMEKGNGAPINAARFIAKFKVEDFKIEFVLKLLPYVIGAVLAGFLVTYRLHVISAKELALKKFDILAQGAGAHDRESNPKNE